MLGYLIISLNCMFKTCSRHMKSEEPNPVVAKPEKSAKVKSPKPVQSPSSKETSKPPVSSEPLKPARALVPALSIAPSIQPLPTYSLPMFPEESARERILRIKIQRIQSNDYFPDLAWHVRSYLTGKGIRPGVTFIKPFFLLH
jgi:hypothetical protein